MTPPNRGELIARGRTAEVFAWADGQVLKLFFDWCPPDWIEREARVSHRLASTSLPTPRLIETITLDGRRGIVFERVEGPSMLALLGTRPWLMPRVAHQFAELHSTIHDNTATDLPSVKSSLERSISTADALTSTLRDRALATLASLPDGQALCHLDFHPDQVAVTPHGPMILDWMTALRGHPLADVAKTSIIVRFAQPPYASWPMRTATALLRRAFHGRYLHRYIQLRPNLRLADLRQWMIPVAAARIADDVPGEQEQILAFLERSIEHPMDA